MAITPWPSTDQARDNALVLLKELLGTDPQNDSRLKLLAAVASARAERDAPEAPQALREEAVVRCVAYLLDSGTGSETRKQIGEESISYSPPGNFWKRSGAAACLRDYIVRHAGAI